jgi:hypothetical protein
MLFNTHTSPCCPCDKRDEAEIFQKAEGGFNVMNELINNNNNNNNNGRWYRILILFLSGWGGLLHLPKDTTLSHARMSDVINDFGPKMIFLLRNQEEKNTTNYMVNFFQKQTFRMELCLWTNQ